MKIAIIGAGISGLAAGRFLAERGHDVDLFEAASGPAAGLLKTENRDGYLFDVGGGHIIYTRDNWLSSFIEELYGDGALVRHQRNTKIHYKGRFVKYPFENGLSDLPPETNFACLYGFIKAYMARPGSEVPDNFRDWIYFRMGDGIAEHFMVPYNEKIWKSDLRDMGVGWVEGRVPEAPLEDIIRSSLGVPTEGYRHQTRFAYPLNGGIHDLAMRVGKPVLDRIRFSHAVSHIAGKGDHGFEVDGASYDEVIYTAPLDRAPRIIEGMDEEAARAAAALDHISLTSFLFGIEEKVVRPYSWVYLPFPEDGPANRLTYLSNYSPNNCPDGMGSLLVEVTHRGPLRVSKEYVRALRRYLHDGGFLQEDRVTQEAHGTVEYAYIFFDKDFTKKRSLALEGLKRLGIHPLGRFGRYNYFNMDHCILAARALADHLQEKHDSV